MILFKSPSWSWDLTNYGISFNEQSDFFKDKISKNFTFPFNAEINEDTAFKLGLVNVEGVVNYDQRIYGFLQLDYSFYDAYIQINGIQGSRAELVIYYGKETLKVFDKKLSQLPWPVEVAGASLQVYAKGLLSQSWPDTSHQFVKVFRQDIKEKSNYEHFDGFLNNYIDTGGGNWDFPVNTNDTIDGETVAVNRNVMAPMVYIMEILELGFKSEGIALRGEFVEDVFNQKLLLVPQNFMEKFALTQFDNYSFTTYTNQTTQDGVTYNEYLRTHTPASTGSYSLKMKVNFNGSQAKYFKLTVVQNGITLYEAESRDALVSINHTLNINIVNATVFHDIEVKMVLLQQSESIGSFNSFTYEYKEGSLNLFPSVYSLADYLPDITFREFINKIKNWFNLKLDYTENAVYIDYLDGFLEEAIFRDKSGLQEPEPGRVLNTNNLFKLSYPNKETVLINKDGETFNEDDYTDTEKEKIEIDVLPLEIDGNQGSITAQYPEDDEDLMVIIYNGTVASENIAVDNIDNRYLRLQDVYYRHWQNWLKYRANSESWKFSFRQHFTDQINIRQGISIYNKKHLIKSIRKKRSGEEFYDVDLETEIL